MSVFRFLLLGIFLTLLPFLSVDAKERDKTLYVRTDALLCLVEHSESYLALGKDPVLVFFDLCPRPEPTLDELLQASSNRSLPQIRMSDASAPPEDVEAAGRSLQLEPAKVASLRRSQIECLVNMKLAGELTAEDNETAMMIDLSACSSYD